MPAGMGEDSAGRRSADDLVDNLKAVLRDAEALLREAGRAARPDAAQPDAATETGAEAQAGTRERLHEAGEALGEHARSAARSFDATVRDHPWTAVAVAAGIGYILGQLGRRR